MLQIEADNFTLTYDFAADAGELRYGFAKQLTANIERGVWIPQNAATWFEFEYSNDRPTKGHRPRTPVLRERLRRLRAIAGLGGNFLDTLTRNAALYELRQWDALMKHGIWLCRDSNCRFGCRARKPRKMLSI